jgi:hypothetical protein
VVDVLDVWGPDPFVDAHLRALLGPHVGPNLRTWRLAEQRVLLERLRTVDEVLDAVAMERRWMLGRLQAVHDGLWRVGSTRVRRRPELDVAPVPPAVPGAEVLYGAQLRATCLAVLNRHGAMGLRDLHGYLHRYGYVVGGNRPVQRLGDCMGFEVRARRARRVARGAYDVHRDGSAAPALAASSVASWSSQPGDPADEPVPVDPQVREMPERWQPSAWALPADHEPIPEPPVFDPEVDDPEHREADVRTEVTAVLETYVQRRRAAARERFGSRDPRASLLSAVPGDSPEIRRIRARAEQDRLRDGGWRALAGLDEEGEGAGGVG